MAYYRLKHSPTVPVGTQLADSKTGAGFGPMTDFGKLLIVLGLLLIVAGIALTFFGRMNLPWGRLPGDIVYRGKNTTFYFPLATSILLSVVLSLVLYLINKFRR